MSSLYHYTNASGLLGILNKGNKTFWLTKSDFLNDISEIDYSRKLLFKVLNNLHNQNMINTLSSR